MYVAPADYHLLVEDGFFSLTTDEPVRFSRPSIDVTFVSAADTYGDRASAWCSPARTATAREVCGASPIAADLHSSRLPATAESPAMPRGRARVRAGGARR